MTSLKESKSLKKMKQEGLHLKRKTSEIVYQSLRRDILNLTLPPGSAISEIETATKYNVSRTPVRDAFRALESEGLLEVRPHIGTFVSQIDLNKVSDMIFMRESLEQTVVKLLANSCTQSQLLKIRLLLKEQENLLANSDSLSPEEYALLGNEFLEMDNEFHSTLFKLAGKSSVWKFMTLYSVHYDRFRILINWSENQMLPTLYQQHCELVELIASKDVERLESLISVHLNSGFASNAEVLLNNASYFTEEE
ncbi:MAG: GntR family transcriptional regulator [Firmicutes bacterium]|uniref:GntR family transcriptional regulator n=1 Tax=Candidatus Scybalomonas excrementavium TaxID=2840943 RepID=A0A9D9N7W4_9FIRM|nr:GntR family transcriptional regulator [Candidatus Scybalomonas excrementavium]